jgi:hypothetical protein
MHHMRLISNAGIAHSKTVAKVWGYISNVLPTLNRERAELIVDGLKHCSSGTNRSVIMWMLIMIWERFGGAAHDHLFPSFHGTYTGYVLV